MMGKYGQCESRKVFMGPGPVSIGTCIKKRFHKELHEDSRKRTWSDDKATRNNQH